MPVVKNTKKLSYQSQKTNHSPYSSPQIKGVINTPKRERERAKMKLEIPPYTCQRCQWQDTPTPSTDKQFDLNIDPKQQNNLLTTELENLKVVYEEFQDRTQQKLLELEGEINWYHRQNDLLVSKLEVFQDNEEELWEHIDYLQDYLEQREQEYTEWQRFQTERLNTCCQTELKLEELLTRYKKGKLSWEKQANLLNTELEKATEESTEQKELLTSKNISITNLSEKLTRLKKELRKQNQANYKKKKQLQRARLHINQNQQKIADKDNVISQLQQDYKNVEHERDTYQTQLEVKDQKIAELEAEIRELKNKPPLPPINNHFSKTEATNNQEINNNFASEKESLLTTINQQKATIKELQQQLTLTTEPEIREVSKTDLTAIRELQTQLRNKEQTISQLHLVYSLTLGVGVLLLVNMMWIFLRKKNQKKTSARKVRK